MKTSATSMHAHISPDAPAQTPGERPPGAPPQPVDVPPLPPTPADPTGIPPAIDDPDAPGRGAPVREPGQQPPAIAR